MNISYLKRREKLFICITFKSQGDFKDAIWRICLFTEIFNLVILHTNKYKFNLKNNIFDSNLDKIISCLI